MCQRNNEFKIFKILILRVVILRVGGLLFPLARELYKKCEIDEIIPETLYKAVAEVLAFVYQSSKKSRG